LKISVQKQAANIILENTCETCSCRDWEEEILNLILKEKKDLSQNLGSYSRLNPSQNASKLSNHYGIMKVDFWSSKWDLDTIPERHCEVMFGDKRRIFVAGYGTRLTEPSQSASMVVTTNHGNPNIITWMWSSDGVDKPARLTTESYNVMLARASDPSQDLLFTGHPSSHSQAGPAWAKDPPAKLLLGGEHNNRPFIAWKRL